MPATDAAAITAARLRIFASRSDYMVWAPHLAREGERCEINTGRRVSHWLAQLAHESDDFTHLEENLNYSAERLLVVWPGRFPALSLAAPYARNPEKLANRVYGDRMGNTHPGDGWKYRGRSLIMITGREGYAKASEWTGLDLVDDPDQAKLPAVAAKIAADFWRVHSLNAMADDNDLVGITATVNGGKTGLADRQQRYRLARTIWRD